MAGPCASVLFPSVFSPNQLEQLYAWLACESDELLPDGQFLIRAPEQRADGGAQTCICLDVQVLNPSGTETERGYRDFSEFAQLRAALRWMPVTEITACADSNREASHQTLAWLMARLAEQFDGAIDLCGKLNVPPEFKEAAMISGELIELPYDCGKPSPCLRHLATPKFLKWWRVHNGGRCMIK